MVRQTIATPAGSFSWMNNTRRAFPLRRRRRRPPVLRVAAAVALVAVNVAVFVVAVVVVVVVVVAVAVTAEGNMSSSFVVAKGAAAWAPAYRSRLYRSHARISFAALRMRLYETEAEHVSFQRVCSVCIVCIYFFKLKPRLNAPGRWRGSKTGSER